MVGGAQGGALDHPVVRVDDSKIASIGKQRDTAVPDAARVIYLGSRTILPGRIDAHTRCKVSTGSGFMLRSIEPSQRKLTQAIRSSRILLEAGVTATRDLGYVDAIHLRGAIEAGEGQGPRMSRARAMITQSAGSPDSHWLPRQSVALAPLDRFLHHSTTS